MTFYVCSCCAKTLNASQRVTRMRPSLVIVLWFSVKGLIHPALKCRVLRHRAFRFCAIDYRKWLALLDANPG